MPALRPELESLPEQMRDLPTDRGYPVPWFVEWIKGPEGTQIPEFRAMSGEKWVKAVKQRLCWVCGQRLGANLAFVIGPMCGITRTTSEPPCHLVCALWSARNCPFLSRPSMVRRDVTNDYPTILPPAGYSIDRNPGVSMVWVTKNYEVFKDGMGGFLIKIGEPTGISCWAEGKIATKEQIEESVAGGLPFLLEKATTPEDISELDGLIAVFRTRLGL